ncbi:hypothetical protein SKAU_G00192710 [Synaphobranchus kaupii]|uniref:Glutaredoxin-related protein 5, mitochondrial n=1 Tax=Synaphobranchus kaupii TaxID=118154 RepID=A0A9Q1FE06_SYNKA|nr:hypothetical protein SKAU_G00192710 [Synaphobranchus kaupii]
MLDTEKGFVKDLDSYLSHRGTLELRKKELLHMRWTERVWMPIQKNIRDHQCVDEEKMRSAILHYLEHCNTKTLHNTYKKQTRYLCAVAGQTDFADIVKKDKVVVFMKGTPAKPMCGFSNAVVQILRMHGVDQYGAYNVLDDQDLRNGVKAFSNWPTIPQVFFNGEFVGGCDILLQMHQNGDLVEELHKLGIRSALLDKEKDGKSK